MSPPTLLVPILLQLFTFSNHKKVDTSVVRVLFLFFGTPKCILLHLALLFFLANPAPQCDLSNGWRPHGSYCYKLKADTRKSWSEARHDCVVEGGDLVSILSAEEEQYVTATLDESHFDLWIGLSTLVRAAP